MRVTNTSELRTACGRAVPGDEIILADGVYALAPGSGAIRTGNQGTVNKPITVRAEHPRKAVIDASGEEEAIRLVRAYWKLENLVLKASGRSTYAVKLEGDAQGCKIISCGIEVGPESECGIKGAGNATGPCPDRCLVQNCLIVMPSPTSYSMAEGIDVVACHGWRILDCRVDGFRTITNGVAFGIMLKGNSKNAYIERCLVTNCFIGISLGGGGTGAEWIRDHDSTYEARNGVIQECIVNDSYDVALYLYAANGTRINKCMIFSSYASLQDGGSSIDVRMPGATAAISSSILDKKVRDRDGGAHIESGNLYLPLAIGKTSFLPK